MFERKMIVLYIKFTYCTIKINLEFILNLILFMTSKTQMNVTFVTTKLTFSYFQF